MQIVYYTIAFCMTLAGIGGYTTQHLVYCIVRITLYLFPENIPGVWRHALPYIIVATVYKGNIIKNLIMDCQSYTKYRPNETTGGIFVSWRRKEELPTGA